MDHAAAPAAPWSQSACAAAVVLQLARYLAAAAALCTLTNYLAAATLVLLMTRHGKHIHGSWSTRIHKAICCTRIASCFAAVHIAAAAAEAAAAAVTHLESITQRAVRLCVQHKLVLAAAD